MKITKIEISEFKALRNVTLEPGNVNHSILNVPHKFPSENFQIIDSHGETSTFKDLLLKRQSGFKDCFRVACFSERFDVMPMWALYAADHTGYVIEYDLEKMTIEQKNNLYKVAYLSKSDLKHIDNHIPRLPIYNLIQKDSECSYELEWRMIKMRGSLEMEDLSL
ncbi:MAG: DUF2971 domain-containing protein [Ruminococcaceae bacterium]|nr:DUF2971 domain-containing protein [Oscillospiraceae bacterium]